MIKKKIRTFVLVLLSLCCKRKLIHCNFKAISVIVYTKCLNNGACDSHCLLSASLGNSLISATDFSQLSSIRRLQREWPSAMVSMLFIPFSVAFALSHRGLHVLIP